MFLISAAEPSLRKRTQANKAASKESLWLSSQSFRRYDDAFRFLGVTFCLKAQPIWSSMNYVNHGNVSESSGLLACFVGDRSSRDTQHSSESKKL